jgi:hypothetical protein
MIRTFYLKNLSIFIKDKNLRVKNLNYVIKAKILH